MDSVAKFFLAFSHETIIIPLVILGYIWLDQKIFYHAICLVLISILFNFALKITFKVPLSPALGKQGFAFPSGHMQSTIVLYGWLMTKIQTTKYKSLLIGLLISIGLSLIYLGYHNLSDILGAIVSGGVLVFIYTLLATTKDKILLLIVLLFSTSLMLYIEFTYKIVEHLWMAYYALIGVSLSESIFLKRAYAKNLSSKIISTILCFITVLIVKIMATYQCIPFILYAQWALIGFCIPWSVFISGFIIQHIRTYYGRS